MASAVESRIMSAPEGSRLLPSIQNPQVTELQAQPANSVNLVQVGLNRLPLLLIGLVAGVVGGFFYHLRVVPIYATSVNLSVSKKKGGDLNPVGDNRLSYVDDIVAMQLAVIKSPPVIEKAAELLEGDASDNTAANVLGGASGEMLKSLGINEADKTAPALGKKFPLGATSRAELAALIHAGLTPTKDEKIGVLVLSFKTSKNQEESAKILIAVIKAYQKYLEDQYSVANDRTVQKFDGIIASTNNDLLKFQTDMRLKEETIKKIHPTGASKLYDSLENQIAKISASIVDTKDRLEELEARYGGRGYIRPNKTGDSENSMVFLSADENTISSLNLEKKILLVDYGKDHPKVRKITMQIDHLQEMRKKRMEAGGSKFDSENPYDRERQLCKQKIEKGEEAIKEAQKQQDVLREDMEKEKELVVYCKDLGKKIESYSRKLEAVEEFRNQIVLTKDHGGYEAKQISKMVGPFASGANRLVYLFVGGFLGLGAGFGLAYLAEVTDRSFQTPDEIRKQLGHTILGHIPTIRIDQDDRKQGSKIEAQLCTFHKPKSTEAEAYRGLRTGLYFSTQNKGHQVIQITSPNAGDGKSTLSGNLSISIAQSGKRVVIVDADMRKPRAHKIFGIENQTKGLSTLIEGNSTIEESTIQTEVPNLFLIPCGPRPSNPAELLTVPRFPQILEELRQIYDIVIVDTPPLLAVSDPCIVAPRVDGVILNILLNKSARSSAVRACEMLAAIDANVLGVVVNCFDSKMRSGAYGYSYSYGYKYSYKYGYRYGYGYNYGYSDYAQYSDDKDPTKKQIGEKGPLSKTNRKE